MQSDDQHLWVTWDEYHRSIEKLALMVHRAQWKFDLILCLARGGLRPGDVFSRIFDVPLAILAAGSYREQAGTVQGELDIAKHITVIKGKMAGRVLLLDDLVDSGVTLQKIQAHLGQQFPEVTEVRTAVIWYKGCSVVKPDYHLQYLPNSPWIHQPFEDYDGLTPDGLEARLEKDSA